MPMKAHENILVFYKNLPTYNPQKTKGHKRKSVKSSSRSNCIESEIYKKGQVLTSYDSTERYPRSVQVFSSDKQKSKFHPVQKPEHLIEYFIKTYTNEGDVILDNAAGSGTTGVSAVKLKRNYILIEKEISFWKICIDRISEATLNR